ncbi:dethiobiotin synthase [Frateuria terrea]|uniref:ATP-dependent dethiobiotin synthetase BioD n=1 Tax=Frateuria terrea TaxID=529704 RepID=A0A1H6S6X0_9GAMM|nr:dethiobiotin synthase [Frateuria terrea]SEI63868.1 dethiobiotin synthetase [Frateuria terrea]SFP24282.1 dethiobiotin synthetase [Frateuria terrea]
MHSESKAGSALFVAGTDTGIGKTHAACTLIHALRAQGLQACGMKPVASGCLETPEGRRNEDALALQAAGSRPLPYEAINPVALREPLSPHLAARLEGVTVAMAPLRTAFDRLQATHDGVVVEGVGGWMVPLAPGLLASAIPRQWDLPVVLVVGLRLGCLNHALLSTRAILADGCRLAGWIGNCNDPAMAAMADNLETLRDMLPAPCLGVLPYGLEPAQAAERLDVAALVGHRSP